MKKRIMTSVASLAVALCIQCPPGQASGVEIQHLEAVQLLSVGAGMTAGQAYNISGVNPNAVGLSSPFVSVSFQNTNAYDVTLANAFASTIGGTASSFVFAGNNVKFAPDITIR